MDKTVASVILAAGQGTRMKSSLPKVLHPILGRPMLRYPLAVAEAVSQVQPVVVVGHHAEDVRAALGGEARFALQERQLGTGHAVMQAREALRDAADLIFVLYGDMPLLTSKTAQMLVDAQRNAQGPISMLTVIAENPRGFGRILRNPDGTVAAIVEEAQATTGQLEIKELNVGVYCFDAQWLWQALDRIPLSPKGEYYLTDTVGLAVDDGLPVQALIMDDITETVGINNRLHLAEAEAVMRDRVNRAWMEAGVSMSNPQTILIEPDVLLEADTRIEPNTRISGNSSISAGSVIGPNTQVKNARVGRDCRLPFCLVEDIAVADGTCLAPFSHVHP